MSYIKRETLLNRIVSLEQLARKRVYDTPTNSPCYERYVAQMQDRQQMLSIIKAHPAADVAEVRHAYWKETKHITESKRGREIHSKLYNCSYCDAPNGRKKSSYCHWCGAKMDGERSGNGT